MTYDTTTSNGPSVRNDSVNEATESNEPRSTVQPISPLQKSEYGLGLSTQIDRQSRDFDHQVSRGNDARMNRPIDSPPSSPLTPSRANSSSEVNGTEVQKMPRSSDDHSSFNEDNYVSNNNNSSDLTGWKNDISDIQAETKQLSTVVSHLEAQTIRGDKDETSEDVAVCYNPALDTEIRNRLDRLNALSDLINSLELKFDQANSLFRETLKCSTDRLSSIAKTLGSKSIRHGRIYHEARVSVEKTQNDCQRACVQFEQANNEHQFAKKAIMEAENRLKQMNIYAEKLPESAINQGPGFEFGDLGRLSLEDDDSSTEISSERKPFDSTEKSCDIAMRNSDLTSEKDASKYALKQAEGDERTSSSMSDWCSSEQNAQKDVNTVQHVLLSHDETKIMNAAKLSEDLNLAINRLIDAENKRRQSEEQHLDQANKLMVAQENLLKLEREYGTSIKRTQIYFEEARRFNVRLNSVKSEIASISEEVIAAKQAYARTLHELEQFSENLHLNPNHLMNSDEQSSSSQQSSDGSEHLNKAN